MKSLHEAQPGDEVKGEVIAVLDPSVYEDGAGWLTAGNGAKRYVVQCRTPRGRVRWVMEKHDLTAVPSC